MGLSDACPRWETFRVSHTACSEDLPNPRLAQSRTCGSALGARRCSPNLAGVGGGRGRPVGVSLEQTYAHRAVTAVRHIGALPGSDRQCSDCRSAPARTLRPPVPCAPRGWGLGVCPRRAPDGPPVRATVSCSTTAMPRPRATPTGSSPPASSTRWARTPHRRPRPAGSEPSRSWGVALQKTGDYSARSQPEGAEASVARGCQCCGLRSPRSHRDCCSALAWPLWLARRER